MNYLLEYNKIETFKELLSEFLICECGSCRQQCTKYVIDFRM